METWQAPYDERHYVRPERHSALLAWMIRIPLLGATAVILLFLLGMLYLALHQLQFNQRIYPGVSAFGVDLSGMTHQQAMTALAARFTYGESAVFTFRDGERFWQRTATELGVSYNPLQTVEAAFKIGRRGNLLENLLEQADAWLNGASVQPIVVFDQSQAATIINQIAAEINRPVLDATLSLNGTQVIATASQIGRQVDVDATLGLLRQVVLTLTTGAEIPIVIRETQPAVRDVEEAAAKVRLALSSPIQLYLPAPREGDPGPWQASVEFISGLLRIQRVENGDGTARYTVSANAEPLRAFLVELAPQLRIEPRNARFVFNEVRRELLPIEDSIEGRELDVESSLKAFEAAIFRAEDRRVPLSFITMKPVAHSKATAAELGITEKIVEATTFFYGSTAERRTNIQVAAQRFHGLVIAPGEVFSFNKYIGDISPETGYETGLVIYGDRTIEGVGGGVCQVSTTIFQAAFFGGYPIVERYPHGYRVGYYESGTAIANGRRYSAGVGMDATVYAPIIDLKFRNDTPYHILIAVNFVPSKQSLTITFYSTSSGRIVEKTGPRLSNVVPHGKPKYTESPNVRPGEVRQIDYAVDGVDARVWRTIRTLDGQILVNNEEFFSRYVPWSAQFLVAPGYAPKQR
ncbi:MAG: VanW family protein [Anaerolineae bacterium]|nr:VanW family protein [Anaerolineae bacterium]MDW8297871.1 VanW family protein [Anaerolineae bacterium]